MILNGTRRPWLPAGPGDASDVSLPSWIEPVRAGLLVAAAPAADADHLVERGPAGERVVGRVHRHEARRRFFMYCSNDVFSAAGHRSSGAS